LAVAHDETLRERVRVVRIDVDDAVAVLDRRTGVAEGIAGPDGGCERENERGSSDAPEHFNVLHAS
jgi:hypothetical protein